MMKYIHATTCIYVCTVWKYISAQTTMPIRSHRSWSKVIYLRGTTAIYAANRQVQNMQNLIGLHASRYPSGRGEEEGGWSKKEYRAEILMEYVYIYSRWNWSSLLWVLAWKRPSTVYPFLIFMVSIIASFRSNYACRPSTFITCKLSPPNSKSEVRKKEEASYVAASVLWAAPKGRFRLAEPPVLLFFFRWLLSFSGHCI